jgi:hypothetical protein
VHKPYEVTRIVYLLIERVHDLLFILGGKADRANDVTYDANTNVIPTTFPDTTSLHNQKSAELRPATDLVVGSNNIPSYDPPG